LAAEFGGDERRQSDDNQCPVFAAKRAFGTRRSTSGRRPERSLAACAVSVGCTAHCSRSTEGFAEEIGAGHSGPGPRHWDGLGAFVLLGK